MEAGPMPPGLTIKMLVFQQGGSIIQLTGAKPTVSLPAITTQQENTNPAVLSSQLQNVKDHAFLDTQQITRKICTMQRKFLRFQKMPPKSKPRS